MPLSTLSCMLQELRNFLSVLLTYRLSRLGISVLSFSQCLEISCYTLFTYICIYGIICFFILIKIKTLSVFPFLVLVTPSTI